MATYTDGYGGDTNTAKDTQLNSGQPELCLGTHSALAQATTEKSLACFILSGIASGSTCNSATLYLYKYTTSSTPSIDSPTTFYHIADANGDWIEGTTNNPAAAGDPCWEAKEADGSGGVTTAWAGSAGMSTAGTDYESSSIGSFTPNRMDAQFTEYQISLDTTVVEGWFGQATNNGIVFFTSVNAGVQMCSSDYSGTSYRPKLFVDYTEAGYTLTAEYGSISLTGQTSGLLADRLLTAAQGSFSESGIAGGLLSDRLLSATQGGYSVSGQAASLLLDLLLAAGQGSFTLSGQNTALLFSGLLGANQGSFTLSGQTTGLLIARLLTAAQGSFVLTGQDTDLVYSGSSGYTLVADSGSFSVSGQTAALLIDRLLTASQGSFALTGQDAALLLARLLAAEAGSITVTGQDTSTAVARILTASQGSYVMSGIAVVFDYSGTIIGSVVEITDQKAYDVVITDERRYVVVLTDSEAVAVEITEELT